jgi:hypothetical protein
LVFRSYHYADQRVRAEISKTLAGGNEARPAGSEVTPESVKGIDEVSQTKGKTGKGPVDLFSPEKSDDVNKIIRSYPKDSEKKFYVYRVQSGKSSTLAGKNAADIAGVVQGTGELLAKRRYCWSAQGSPHP